MASNNLTGVSQNSLTSRDKLLAEKKRAQEASRLAGINSRADKRVADLTAQVITTDTTISNQHIAVQTATTAPAIALATAALTTSESTRKALDDQLSAAKTVSTDLKSAQTSISSVAVATAAAGVTAFATGAYTFSRDNVGNGAASNNASAVKEAYFSNRSSFVSRVQSPLNQPSAVVAASNLFASINRTSKGMIVTSQQVLQSWNSGSNSPQGSSGAGNYAFQFQYNPGTVGMSYFTSPNVDVAMMTSGQEMFNLSGVSGSQGSINFQVIINRVFDMQYFDESGRLTVAATDIYPVQPLLGDYKDIYEKGTMYDVEYLLRVLMGTTMKSYLRSGPTADMGWLPAIPVELHLGKSLRYLGTVNSLNLNHMIFDSRMVPMFTTLDIAFARLPDYPATGTTA